jgi:HPt (histidine-containing phosphotransfer) domain-containing protein
MEPEDLDAVLERWVLAPSADVGTAHTEGPVDRETLARLHGLQGEDEPNIVVDLAGIFLKDARSRLVAVEEALQEGDASAVERAAHTLKGGSGSMGARRMSSLCTQLEHVSASGDLSLGSELLGRIREELGRVERALEAEVSGNSFQVKWFQPDKPSTCSSPRSKTTSDWVISPMSVRGTSTLFARASRTDPGAQIRSS